MMQKKEKRLDKESRFACLKIVLGISRLKNSMLKRLVIAVFTAFGLAQLQHEIFWLKPTLAWRNVMQQVMVE